MTSRRTIQLCLITAGVVALAWPNLRLAVARGAAAPPTEDVAGKTYLHVESVNVRGGARNVAASFDVLVVPGVPFSCGASIDGRAMHLDGVVGTASGGYRDSRVHFSAATTGGGTIVVRSDLLLSSDKPARVAGGSASDVRDEVVEVTLTRRPR